MLQHSLTKQKATEHLQYLKGFIYGVILMPYIQRISVRVIFKCLYINSKHYSTDCDETVI